jgi:hypothetical protein
MGDIHKLLDERFTSPPQRLSLPGSLPIVGVYFAGGEKAWLLSLPDAEVASGYLGQDAIWSGICGSYAAFLYHENLRWLCYRKPAVQPLRR